VYFLLVFIVLGNQPIAAPKLDNTLVSGHMCILKTAADDEGEDKTAD
jgi:hypothetical protein